jgi:glycosidase
MNKLRLFCLLLFASLSLHHSRAQVITYTPAYPTVNDSITILFDATQGNGACAGVSPIFIHSGVISWRSINNSDWQFKKRTWENPDSVTQMQAIGPNQYRIKFHIRNWYGFGTNEKVRALAMVFRDSTGSFVGKNADGTDIFIPIYDAGFSAKMISPLERPAVRELNQTLNIQISATQAAFINLYRDNVIIGQAANTQLYNYSLPLNQSGKFWLRYTAESGVNVESDSMYVIVEGTQLVQDPPAGTGNGINILNDSTARLCLLAPFKNKVYAVGDFSNWELDPQYRMIKSQNGERYWIDIHGLTPGAEVRFQYLVDNDIRIADPNTEKVLDPNLDGAIIPIFYPNLIPYPAGKTTEAVAVMQPGEPAYIWQVPNFQKPDVRDLVVYELLVRDFVNIHTFDKVRDSLSYLKKLGINAIEFMPWTEFDGNESWGYGPNFFFAVDKTYGPKEKLKQLIDECHAQGIAVIMDVVLNHAFGLNPYVRLWQNKETGKPTPQNPFFNPQDMHPFSVGLDFNHESQYTKDYCDTILAHWIAEYKVDGFRFDLSKGFTQNYTFGDIAAWGAYDLSRVNLIKRMVSKMWQNYPFTYAILEHFADNTEETELANFGCMFWGKATTQYNQATMGWASDWDFEWQTSYQARGWAMHNLMAFMESHDEERLMFRNINYGNISGTYNTKSIPTALERMGAGAALFFTIPGPKMLWQFGELGYDYSINWPSNTDVSRTAPKPVKWDYLMDANRHRLFKTYAALIKLKTENTAFRTASYDISAWGSQKQVYVNDPSMNCVAIANFGMQNQDCYTGFQHTGTWYDYFTGQPLTVNDVNMTINLAPGKFKVFTDQQLALPDMSIPDSVLFPPNPGGTEDRLSLNSRVAPNPFSEHVVIQYYLNEGTQVKAEVFDISGRLVAVLADEYQASGLQDLFWDGISSSGNKAEAGTYYYRISTAKGVSSGKLVLQK